MIANKGEQDVVIFKPNQTVGECSQRALAVKVAGDVPFSPVRDQSHQYSASTSEPYGLRKAEHGRWAHLCQYYTGWVSWERDDGLGELSWMLALKGLI